MALSALYVRFSDVAIIWVVVAQVLFYGTPILYPVDVQVRASTPLMVNPLSVIFMQIRLWIIADPTAPNAVEAAGGWLGLLPAATIFVGRLRIRRLVLQSGSPSHRPGPLAPRVHSRTVTGESKATETTLNGGGSRKHRAAGGA